MSAPSKLAVEIEDDFLKVAMLDMSEEVRLCGTLAALIDAKIRPLVEDGARQQTALEENKTSFESIRRIITTHTWGRYDLTSLLDIANAALTAAAARAQPSRAGGERQDMNVHDQGVLIQGVLLGAAIGFLTGLGVGAILHGLFKP